MTAAVVTDLQDSWAIVAGYGVEVPRHFYARLFIAHPELRPLFPMSMHAQQDRLVAALGNAVASVGELDRLVPFLQALGRDHRKFQVRDEDYAAVGEALLGTLAHFLGDQWTEHLAARWREAYRVIAGTMSGAAADEDHAGVPPYWTAEIVEHTLVRPNLARLVLAPDAPYGWRAGQSVGVMSPDYAQGVWRFYSPASAVCSAGLVLHVRAVPGGQLSPQLVHTARKGDLLRLAAPVGERLTTDTEGPPLAILAGGTGLAPALALIDQFHRDEHGGRRPRQTLLVYGLRSKEEIGCYPMEVLAGAERWPWLRVYAASEDPAHTGTQGSVAEAALGVPQPAEWEYIVVGSPAMVAATLQALQRQGVPPRQISTEEYQSGTYTPTYRSHT